MYQTKQLAKILGIEKTKSDFCHSRYLTFTVQIQETKEIVTVNWAKVPTIITSGSLYSSKAPHSFTIAWHYMNIGDTVVLWHGNDRNSNYLTFPDESKRKIDLSK